MRLGRPPKHTMRVHELAKELGWPPGRLVDELRTRGEWVKSAMSTVEPPVVRAILRDFAAAGPEVDPEESLEPSLYGHSANLDADTSETDETFSEALARVKAGPPRHPKAVTSKANRWRPPVLQALLDEIITQRPGHLGQPSGEHFGWELKKAEQWHLQRTRARLNGLAGEDPVVIQWIRLSDGQRPRVAAELSRADITPEEANLRLGYSGRIDSRMDTLYNRFQDRRTTRAEVVAAVRYWRWNNATGGIEGWRREGRPSVELIERGGHLLGMGAKLALTGLEHLVVTALLVGPHDGDMLATVPRGGAPE